MIQNSKKSIEDSRDRENTLKYSKSAESLAQLRRKNSKGNTTQTFFKNGPSSKKDLNVEVDEKTEIIERRNSKAEDLEDKLIKIQS